MKFLILNPCFKTFFLTSISLNFRYFRIRVLSVYVIRKNIVVQEIAKVFEDEKEYREDQEKKTKEKRRREETRKCFLFIVYKISAFIFVAQYRIKKLLFL